MSNFKGIWIPASVWVEDKLTLMEKFFLVRIEFWDKKEGCFASNGRFADFFNLSKSRCSRIINSLESKGYISSAMIRNGKVIVKRLLNLSNKAISLFKEAVESNGEDGVGNPESQKVDFSSVTETMDEVKEVAASEEQEVIEVPPTDYGFQATKNKTVKPRQGSNWTQLDITLHNYKYPEDWGELLVKEVKTFFKYMEEKKGKNWGTLNTVQYQINHIKELKQKYKEDIIIESISECIRKGNVSYEPKWLISRKNKEKDEEQKRARSGKPESQIGKFGKMHLSDNGEPWVSN